MGQLLKHHDTFVDLGEVFDRNLAVDSLICLLSFYSTLKSYLKLLPTTTKSRNFLFSQAYIFSFGTWIAEKGALGNDPYLLHWQILSGNTITEANRSGIPLLCCFTHKILLRRLHQLTYKHLMQGARTIPPYTHWIDGGCMVKCIEHA